MVIAVVVMATVATAAVVIVVMKVTVVIVAVVVMRLYRCGVDDGQRNGGRFQVTEPGRV